MDMESPNGVKNTELDYILINRPFIVTYITVTNQVNIGSDNSMVMSNINSGRRNGKEKLMTKRPQTVDAKQIV